MVDTLLHWAPVCISTLFKRSTKPDPLEWVPTPQVIPYLAHKGQKLSRWMTPPTAIAAIASFHVHAVLHIIHSPCICLQQPASTSKRDALQLSTCNQKPTQPGSSVPSTPPNSDSNPATRQKAPHQYPRGLKTHATTLHAPPTPGYCPHGAITQRSRWHSFGPRISSGPY